VEKVVERWGRDGGGQIPAQQNTQDRAHSLQLSDELFSFDAEAFGMSRNGLLEVLSTSGKGDATPNGYVLSRHGRTARYLGPCVVGSELEAQELIGAHLEGDESESWYWDLLPANTAAIRCARKFGFTRRRTLWRMRRGEMMESNDAMVYAIAGFELG
jgi:Acetyltransferase (GNAT) domain